MGNSESTFKEARQTLDSLEKAKTAQPTEKHFVEWRAKVWIPSGVFHSPVLPISEDAFRRLSVLMKITKPEYSPHSLEDPDFSGLVALTYGELADVSKDPAKILELKGTLLDRLEDKDSEGIRDVWYGELERLENVVERLALNLPIKETPFWDGLMEKDKTPNVSTT